MNCLPASCGGKDRPDGIEGKKFETSDPRHSLDENNMPIDLP